MTKNTLLKTLASLVLITWASIYAMNSETVVDYVFHICGDNPPEYFNYNYAPIWVDRVVEVNEWKELKMPLQIEQASGLSVRAHSFLFTTDKAEVIQTTLDESGNLEYNQTLDILNLPLLLKQGHMEAVSFWENTQIIYAIGWNTLYTIDASHTEMKILSETLLLLPTQTPGELIEVQSMVYHPETEHIYIWYSPDDEEGVYIAEITIQGSLVRQVPVHHGTDTQNEGLLKALPWFIASWMSIHQGRWVVLSDQHSSLLWINIQTGEVEEIWWLADLHDMTSLSIYDWKIYMTQDHEYYQDIPALRVLDISGM